MLSTLKAYLARRKPSSAGRLLAAVRNARRREETREYRAKVRAQVDRMNAELGRPPIRWPSL